MASRILVIIFASTLIFICFGVIVKLNIYAQSSYTLDISSNDLNKAGYIEVTQQPPEGLMYQPATYFWVNGTLDKTNVANLLMISQYHQDTPYTNTLFNYGISRQQFTIPGGVGQENVLANDSRVALNFAKGNYYIVIIGPDLKKIEALALIIAAKI